MWTRKELKVSAKKNIMKNYILCIAACFILSFFTSNYSSTLFIIHNSNSKDTKTDNVAYSFNVKNALEYAFGDNFINFENEHINAMINNQINSLTQSHTYIFKFVGVLDKIINCDISNAFVYLFAGLLELLYTIFVAHLIIVGVRGLFLHNSNTLDGKKVDILEFASSFKGHHIKNIAYVMFCRLLFYFLWSLTIIGIFIKIYEYRMIPFILSEHPDMKRKEVFNLSKEMMYGNKWRAFVLDLSFFGWNLLSVITFGLSGIFYSNAYHLATITELYKTLKTENS